MEEDHPAGIHVFLHPVQLHHSERYKGAAETTLRSLKHHAGNTNSGHNAAGQM